MSDSQTADRFEIKNERRVLDLGLALGHSIRVKALAALKDDPPLSAARMHRRGIANLSLVRYHLGQLESVGAIEPVRASAPTCGGPAETLFELTSFGEACLRVAALIGRQ